MADRTAILLSTLIAVVVGYVVFSTAMSPAMSTAMCENTGVDAQPVYDNKTILDPWGETEVPNVVGCELENGTVVEPRPANLTA